MGRDIDETEIFTRPAAKRHLPGGKLTVATASYGLDTAKRNEAVSRTGRRVPRTDHCCAVPHCSSRRGRGRWPSSCPGSFELLSPLTTGYASCPRALVASSTEHETRARPRCFVTSSRRDVSARPNTSVTLRQFDALEMAVAMGESQGFGMSLNPNLTLPTLCLRCARRFQGDLGRSIRVKAREAFHSLLGCCSDAVRMKKSRHVKLCPKDVWGWRSGGESGAHGGRVRQSPLYGDCRQLVW